MNNNNCLQNIINSLQNVNKKDIFIFPASYAQIRLWFLQKLEPESLAYNNYIGITLKGKLDKNALEQTMNEIVHRHEALRTRFTIKQGQPLQVIIPHRNFKLSLTDLSCLPEKDRQLQIDKIIRSQCFAPFDLEKEPLLRISLLKIEQEEHILLLTIHHINWDGWSVGILIRELGILYQAFRSGKPSPLPKLPIQYADYTIWQQKFLQGKVLEKLLEYWKQQLHNCPVLTLPTDNPRSNIHTSNGATESFIIPKHLTQKLKQISQKENATLFMTLLSAFKILLYRYTQQEDIVVGSPIANRNQKSTEELIGCFINALALRTDLSGNITFKKLLNRVRRVTLDAQNHQNMPFAKLVELLQPERNLNISPLFQVMFVLQNFSTPLMELQDLKLKPLSIDTNISEFDLTLFMQEINSEQMGILEHRMGEKNLAEAGLIGILEYKTDLFKSDTIQCMVKHFQTLLESIVNNTDEEISKLPILTKNESQKLLLDWNNTKKDYPKNICIHELFEAQVEKTPDAIALEFQECNLTYSQLNVKANQLANYLRELGVKSDSLVGISLERNLNMVVGLLGILKAGGAYVPLDPTYPQSRLEYMLENSQLQVLVTQEKLASKFSKEKLKIVYLDKEWENFSKTSKENLETKTNNHNLAYVIHTSGSTGKPKGVQIKHHSVVNFLNSMAETPGLTKEDILLAVTTISFDIAGLELYLPLSVGAKIVLVSNETASDGKALLELLHQSGATIMQATPATWQLLLAAQWQNNLGLKILCGGEALPRKLAQQLQEKSSSLWNMYGPTEATIWSTIHRVNEIYTGEDYTPVSIGRPIANTEIYILDSHLQPLPIGIPGELYIGGEGLAKGYLNRPDLTVERFVDNPLDPSKKIYKTGDKAKYLPDGKIEYLGRIDNQVKIRGFRIELGEIESVLDRYPNLEKSVVIALEDENSQKTLVAYIVSHSEKTPNITELRNFLQEKLPSYMIPSSFVFLEAFPLTPNGKIDRRALPKPNITRENLAKAFIAPRTPTEEIVAGIWAELLALEVGMEDNFFELGGHSLLATQVISRICQAFSIELPLRVLFESPTIAELSTIIEKTNQTDLTTISPIDIISRNENIPLSFTQKRLWFLNELEGHSATYNMPGAVLLTGKLNVIALENSIHELVKRHEILRTTFKAIDGQPFQIIHPESDLIPLIDAIDLRSCPKDEREITIRQLATEQRMQPFNLETGPLLRFKLLQLEETEHILLIVLHHIISDAWSAQIVIQEITILYNALSTEEKIPENLLPKLNIQFADYAYWQKQWLQGKKLHQQLAYWKEKLANAPTLLNISTDYPRSQIISNQGSSIPFSISSTLNQAIETFKKNEKVTLFMILFSAFLCLMDCYSNDEDICIGSPIANRNRKDTEGIIGFFANTIVLRCDLSGNPNFKDLLVRVKEVSLEAYTHQDIPFEKLVEELQPDRNLNYNPLFQVWFVLQNAPQTSLEFPELTWKDLEIDTGIVRHDLMLSLSESKDGLDGKFEYKTDLFQKDTINQMIENLKIILEKMTSQPDMTLNKIREIVNEAREKHRLNKEKQLFSNVGQKLKRIKRKK